MADTLTTNISLVKPEVGADQNTWGTINNSNMDLIDTSITNLKAGLLPLSGGTITGALTLSGNTNVTTGTLNLNGTPLRWDGANLTISGATVFTSLSGSPVFAGYSNVFTVPQKIATASPQLVLQNPNIVASNSWDLYHWSDGNFYLRNAGANTFTFGTNGTISTSQLGDLATYIASQAQYYANQAQAAAIAAMQTQLNQSATQFRLSAGGYDYFNSNGDNANAPGNSICVGFGFGFTTNTYIEGHMYVSYFQYFIPSVGWVTM